MLEHLDEFEQAEQHFQAALKYDTKRFRTDGVLNDIIMKVADDTSGDAFAFVNSVEKFAKASQPNVPGWDLLHEHVHFDYAGNYVLARAFTAAIMADIKPSEPFTELASDDAAERIGFPNHETNQVMNRLLGMINKSPFTEQINHAELAAFTEARRDQIVKQVGSPQEALMRRQELIRQGIADWKIHYELAELNRFVRDREASAFHLKELIKQYPHNHESYIKLAELESASGNFQQSIQYLERSMYYARNDAAKKTQALGWIGSNYMKLGNYSEAVRYFENIIDQHPDQIAATMRAYGALIKFARDENQRDDFHRYVAGVKRYAKNLIAQDRVNEFPLLYRRMAQIMTIAEDKVEAQRWQSMQAENN